MSVNQFESAPPTSPHRLVLHFYSHSFLPSQSPLAFVDNCHLRRSLHHAIISAQKPARLKKSNSFAHLVPRPHPYSPPLLPFCTHALSCKSTSVTLNTTFKVPIYCTTTIDVDTPARPETPILLPPPHPLPSPTHKNWCNAGRC